MSIIRRMARTLRLVNDLAAVERDFLLFAMRGGAVYAGKHRRKKKARSRKRTGTGPKTK